MTPEGAAGRSSVSDLIAKWRKTAAMYASAEHNGMIDCADELEALLAGLPSVRDPNLEVWAVFKEGVFQIAYPRQFQAMNYVSGVFKSCEVRAMHLSALSGRPAPPAQTPKEPR